MDRNLDALLTRNFVPESPVVPVHKRNHPWAAYLQAVWAYINRAHFHHRHSPRARLRRAHRFALRRIFKLVILKEASDEHGLALELLLQVLLWTFTPSSRCQENTNADRCYERLHYSFFLPEEVGGI